jgi:hypothetical protein
MASAPSAPRYHDLLASQDWAELRKKLKAYAWKATGCRSMDRAEDLAHDVVARLWTDAGVRWDPMIEPNLFRFLTGLLRGELSNERRLKRTSNEILAGDETIEAVGGVETPETLLMLRQETTRVFGALRERTAVDPVGATVAELFANGIDGASEQAEASGTPIDDIRLARKRVFRHAEAIKRDMGEVA